MSRSGLALRVVGGATLAVFALAAFTPLPNALCRRSVVAAMIEQIGMLFE